MDTLKNLREELTAEYITTQNFLEGFPTNKNDYAPHSKSMKLGSLTNHILDIFGWPYIILNTDFIDLSSDYKPIIGEDKKSLQDKLDSEFNKSITALEEAKEEDLEPQWSIRKDGIKLMEWSKYGAMRQGLNQITHHRAQLGVYFRLLDIPVPGSYGPSADTTTT
ncbi:damage-inducible protein DinB [Aequorivita sp. H23M31]|uniref:Damage-inducible protein DinB n=1 Tax=Aequorivita ciconiae TaxID=2494375 RepID=A0A410G644_9FLAO|nr:DinB family protein [Aequorivita sp. H23M31]QAA82733.1 damage-inducible protein DinB [Aequorivita sp. H23M31]